MKWRISSSRRTAMLGIASLVLAAFVGLSWRQWEHYRQANTEAEHSRETLIAIDNVLTTVVDAETGQRGFLLTGQTRYLDPYNRALQQLPKELKTLKKLLGASRTGMQHFDELNALAHMKLDELRQSIDIRRAQGAKAALAMVLTGEGERTMDAIRALCAQMERDQNANQERAYGDAEGAAGIGLLITVAGSVVLLFLFAFGLEPFASPDPVAWRRPGPVRYGGAVIAVLAITLIRAALTPLMGPTSMPFTLYFCAVAFAAWFGGFRAAVLSIVLSLLAGSWFFAKPTGSLLVSGHDDQVAC